MSQLYSQRCDLCQAVQTEEESSKIKGTMFSVNGISKFACAPCKLILDAAFAVGAEGLRDPVKALAVVVKERDELKRLLAQATVRRQDGDLGLISVERDHREAQRFNALTPAERFKPENQIAHRPMPAGKLGLKEDKKSKKK